MLLPQVVPGQDSKEEGKRTKAIHALIDQYSLARDTKDSVLLKSILTEDVDQLVSSGEWRKGIGEAIQGMQRSSESNPGSRSLRVENIRFLDSKNVLADARYEIRNAQGNTRSMWSTFVLVYHQGRWKIAAIRNMLPSGTH
jgi:uncharacterized protein (TIGR02246 family)